VESVIRLAVEDGQPVIFFIIKPTYGAFGQLSQRFVSIQQVFIKRNFFEIVRVEAFSHGPEVFLVSKVAVNQPDLEG
jgi:hypothetical protein